MAMEWTILIFLFVLGACIGSFLNVVVFRLMPVSPEVGINEVGPPDYSLRAMLMGVWYDLRALIYPPSTCPNCNTRLAARDNIPVLGWILLKGKCRYCKTAISVQYPIIEALVGVLFVVMYVLLFWFGFGPCAPGVESVNRFGEAIIVPAGMQIARDWPMLMMYLLMTSGVIAASVIDARTFMIPLSITWFVAAVGIVGHAIVSVPGQAELPGNVLVGGAIALMTLAFVVGWIVSLALLQWGVIPRSFAMGEPAMPGTDNHSGPTYSRGQVTTEMLKESAFLALPLLLSAIAGWAALRVPGALEWANQLAATPILAGACGALFGGIVGGLLVWLTRILGSIAFGKEAMGLGDVHLQFGIGAVLGAWGATVSFFIAPFAGILIAVYLLLFSGRRHLPFGPYLSGGAIVTVVLSCLIWQRLSPGLEGLRLMVGGS